MTKIVAIAGSPSHPSRSYAVLEEAQKILKTQGAELEILLVRDLPAEDLLHARFDSATINAATAQVTAADAVIISTPVYKAAYTGILKAFLDLLPQKALLGKPILPIATGGTLAHLLAIDYALNPVLGVLGATHILQGVYLVDTQFQRLETGGIEFSDPELQARFHNAITELLQMLPWRKVIENVALGLKEQARPRSHWALQQVGLDNRAQDWTTVLSGGQQQRVALARALVTQPQLLLLDEPLGALDALTRIDMQRLIETLWQEQQFTALLVTHDVEEAVVLSDRVIVIQNGQIDLDLPINLSRPRHIASPTLAELKQQILSRILQN